MLAAGLGDVAREPFDYIVLPGGLRLDAESPCEVGEDSAAIVDRSGSQAAAFHGREPEVRKGIVCHSSSPYVGSKQ